MPVSLLANSIKVHFAYNPALVSLAKALPDRWWERKSKSWVVPATPYHARRVIAAFSGKVQIDESVMRLSTRDSKDYNNSTLELTSSDHLKPRPYQAGAVEFLNDTFGRAIIADAVGLGKTCEALSWAAYRGIQSVLIVAPASVLYKWQKEVAMWYPDMADKTCVIASSATPITGRIHIISYDMMTRLKDNLPKHKLIIFDEVQRLRNYKTLRFKAAKQLAQGTPHIIGLSGTPIMNRPRELYNILNLLDPFAWTWVNFFNRYCGGEEMGYNGATNLDDLNERLKSIMLRRFKTDVLDQLPAFTRTHVPVSLEPEERNTYDRLASQNPTTIVNLFPGSKGYFANPLDWLNAIRQYLERLRLSRVEDWAEDFLSSGTGKLVIYCGFKSSVARLEESLKEYGVAKITGDVSNSNRQEIIDRWQTTNDERVMLLTSAGGEGIDLFGKNGIECSTLVFAGREWSPMVEEQIEGRLDRMGQTFPVEAVYLTIQGTVDEDIDALIEEKRTIIRDALGLETVDTNIVGDLFEILKKRGVIFKEHKEKKHGEG